MINSLLTAAMHMPIALTIEDDKMMALMIQFTLEHEGFQVEIAEDGKCAQQMIGQIPPPALVTLDLMLPYIDGFELLQMIRAQPAWQDVPVLVITSLSEQEAVARALNGGANSCMIKPFRQAELSAQIRRLTGRTQ